MSIQIKPPVRDVYVSQPFAVNYVNFYKKMGFAGHPGIDFRTKRGCPIRAAHDGLVSWCGQGRDSGNGVELWDERNKFKTFYYHHLENKTAKGKFVKQGDVIALANNTGKYTTADHEHFELYKVDNYGNTLNTDNGYGGAIDPAPYMPKNWDKTPAWHRYGREGSYWAELKIRFKNPWLHRYLIKRNMIHKVYDNEFINALTYGGWAIDEVINDSMRGTWAYRKKYDDNHFNIFKQ